MATNKIKITFILPSLAAGGSERILSFVAQNLETNIFETTLLITGYEKDTVYKTDGLHLIYLNKSRVLKSVSSLFSHFKKENPNIVVSSIVHLNTLVAFISICFPKIKFVAREASVLTLLDKYNPYTKSAFPKWMIKLAYKFIDRIVCQSKDMQTDMVTNYGVPNKKTVLINNPITKLYPLKTRVRNSSEPLKLITVGRLSKEKGFDRLIKALAEVHFNFEYTIIGDGVEKDSIMELIDQNNLTNSINYISYTDQVAHYLSESDLFLQGSYVDGFPNVLIESSVVGTPILAFQAPGGLKEIVEHGKNGYVVNTSDKFVNQLNDIHANYTFKPEVVSNVVKDKFSSDKIMIQYTNLFKSLIQKN